MPEDLNYTKFTNTTSTLNPYKKVSPTGSLNGLPNLFQSFLQILKRTKGPNRGQKRLKSINTGSGLLPKHLKSAMRIVMINSLLGRTMGDCTS